MKKINAYILSREHGTIQIGDTVFQPCTGNRFVAPVIRGKKSIGKYEKTMQGAIAALHSDR